VRWDEPCSALRRDGQPCQAPTIKGGFVCRRHGGSAPQVRIAAQRRLLQDRIVAATEEWWAAKGTGVEFERLCGIAAAERDLRAFEARVAELARLRTAVRAARKRAAEREKAAGAGQGSTSAQEAPAADVRLISPADRFARPDAPVVTGPAGVQRSPFA
jgi:hypothetical protein